MTSQRLSPFDIMCHLVAFPTVSKDSNLPLIDWVETYLKSHHITPHRCYNGEKDKAALFAHVGPETAGGVVLSGHSDVVPVAGQLWEQDPWTVLKKDNRYYGRGTCDMKGFVAWRFGRLSRRAMQTCKNLCSLRSAMMRKSAASARRR